MRRSEQLARALADAVLELEHVYDDMDFNTADEAVDYHEWIEGLRDVLYGAGRILH